MNPASIISLWYEPGTAWDAAAAANKHLAQHEPRLTAYTIERHWKKAQREGHLPPIARPHNGQFPPEHQAMLMVCKEATGRAA